jgi:hypothetical protein
MEKYYGNYLGIVVSDDGQDPERRNRIQVWVPGITNTMYGGWNDDFTDKKIYYIGEDSQLKHEDIQKLRAVLPWAECASPLIGGGGTSLYYGTGGGRNYQSSQPVQRDDSDESVSDESAVDFLNSSNDKQTGTSLGVQNNAPNGTDIIDTSVVTKYKGYTFYGYNQDNIPLYTKDSDPSSIFIIDDLIKNNVETIK